jgi:predicted outer membrane repeat protein
MLRITLCCLVVGILAPSALAATHRVPSEYPTIQAGIDACSDGDTVLVAAGTYTGPGNIELDIDGRTCTLLSESGYPTTAIDCLGSGEAFSMYADGSSNVVIAGFTIKDARDMSDAGGAIRARDDKLTVRDCYFIGNASSAGGAIYFSHGELRVEACRFEGNHADWDGGAIVATVGAHLEAVQCEFIGNQAGATGGAIYANGADSVTLQDCLVQGNFAGAVGAGGMSARANCLIERVDFVENSSQWDGGALLLSASDATTIIRDCKFIRNEATGRDGGAIAMGLQFDTAGSPGIESCLFFGNVATGGGGAVACGNFSTPTFRSCTFVRNVANTASGGAFALYWHSEPIIENTIIALSERGGGIKAIEWSAPHLSCSDVWGNVDGNFLVMADPTGTDGNISADPRFCGAQPDDFTLQANSPCAPANNSCGVLIGLYGVDCDSVAVQSESWGGIKSLY